MREIEFVAIFFHQDARYGCPIHSSSGFKVMLHSTTSNPFMIDHGQIIGAGAYIRQYIVQKIVQNLKIKHFLSNKTCETHFSGREHFVSATPLVVQANKGLYGISPTDRKCYLYNEKQVGKHYRYYHTLYCIFFTLFLPFISSPSTGTTRRRTATPSAGPTTPTGPAGASHTTCRTSRGSPSAIQNRQNKIDISVI